MLDLEHILRAEPDTVESLASGDLAAWQRLLEHVVLERGNGLRARPELVVAWLAHSSLIEWRARAQAASVRIDSHVFSTSKTALRGFDAWLSLEALSALPANHPATLEARFTNLLHPASPFDPNRRSKLEQLASDLATAGATARRAEICLLLARELEGQPRVMKCAEAEELFGRVGDPAGRTRARLAYADALIRVGAWDEALAIFEQARPVGWLDFALGRPLEPITQAQHQALEEASVVLHSATPLRPAWIRLLGVLGDVFAEPRLSAMFRDRLEASVRERDGCDLLGVVVEQTWQRGFNGPALAAVERLERLGCEEVDAALAALQVLQHEGELLRALNLLRRAIQAQPRHEQVAVAARHASGLALALGELEESRQWAARAAAGPADQ